MTMKFYPIVLFDLDGTLTDPKVGITKSVQYALFKMGIDEPDAESLTPFIGPPLYTSFQKYYGMRDSEAIEAVRYYREYFTQDGMYENEVFAGIPELLAQLTAASRRLLVATSKPTVFAEEILQHFHLDGYFEHVVGSHLDGSRSNKAEVVSHAMRQCGEVPKADFVMVGDREHDMIGASANGVNAIGVTYGYGSRAELEAAKATYIAESVAGLRNLLMGCAE